MESTVGVERTPAGRRLVVRRSVAASRDDAWDLLTDTERWPDWGPSVREVNCNVRYIQAGTTGRVSTVGGLWLPFEVDECKPYRWTWRVARIPATGHRVDEAVAAAGGGGDASGDQPRCRVGFEIPLLATGYLPVCQRALGQIAALLE